MRLLKTVIVLALFGSLPASAIECPERLGDWPFGPTKAVAIEGNLAFFSSGAALMIADISDPESPTVLGSLGLGGPMEDLKVANGFAYITDQAGERLVVVDATNAAEPVIAGTLDRTTTIANGGWRDFDVADEHLYIPDYNTVRVIDVSNPANPVEVGFYDNSPFSGIWPIVASGQYVFVSYSDLSSYPYVEFLSVLSIGDPTNPVEVGTVELPDSPWSLASYGHFIYAAIGNQGFGVYDVSDPTNPLEITVFDSIGIDAYSIVASRDVVFWASIYDELHAVDVTDPSNPADAGVVSVGGNIKDLTTANGHVFAAATEGLSVIDAANPTQLEQVAFLNTTGAVEDVLMSGNLALVAAGKAGLRVVDTSNPESPRQVGSLDARDSVGSMGLSGHHAVLADGGLRVVDIGDPSHPIEVGFSELLNSNFALLEVSGEHVFAAIRDDMTIFDISDPTAPAAVGSLSLPSSGSGSPLSGGLTLEGNYIYRELFGTLFIIDISNPSAPVLLSEFDLPWPFNGGSGVVVRAGTAFVASNGGLVLVDVSDPTAPIALSYMLHGRSTTSLDIWNQFLLVGSSYWSDIVQFDVWDVTYPTNPSTVGSYDLLSEITGIAVAEGVAAVGTSDAGVSFFDVDSCALTPPTAAFTFEPDFPKAGVPVEFTDLSSGTPTAWSWNFGDGGTSSEQNPSHVYDSSGDFTVSLTATNGGGSGSVSARVVVEPFGERVYIPAVGIGPGAGDSFWSSDVVVNNRGDEQITYEVQYLAKGRDNTVPQSGGMFTLDPGVSVSYRNVLEMFGINAGSGALCLVSEDLDDAVLMSRTKSTDSVGATFGQGIPPVGEDDLFDYGSHVRLIGLSETEALRTNIGFLNGSGHPVSLNVQFFDSEDNLLGSDRVQLEPYSCDQWNKAFNRIGASGTENGWIDVTLQSGGRFFTYASVVDNLKDDPTYVSPQLAGSPGSNRVFVPASGVGAGVGASVWSTDVVVSWRSTNSSIPLSAAFLPKGENNSSPQEVELSLPHWANNGRSLLFEDILAALFDLNSGSGALVFDFDFESSVNDYVLLSSRTKNTDIDGATFGQGIPAVDEDDLTPAGVRVRLVQLSQNSELRTNIGFMNGKGTPITLDVEFFDNGGASLGVETLVLQPYSFEQWNRAFNRVGKTTVDNGYVDVWTTTQDGKFYTFASVIDMVKDDPTYVMPQ